MRVRARHFDAIGEQIDLAISFARDVNSLLSPSLSAPWRERTNDAGGPLPLLTSMPSHDALKELSGAGGDRGSHEKLKVVGLGGTETTTVVFDALLRKRKK